METKTCGTCFSYGPIDLVVGFNDEGLNDTLEIMGCTNPKSKFYTPNMSSGGRALSETHKACPQWEADHE